MRLYKDIYEFLKSDYNNFYMINMSNSYSFLYIDINYNLYRKETKYNSNNYWL